MQRDDFKKFALDSLDNFNKKPNSQIHREKTIGNKKFIINNNIKSKKKWLLLYYILKINGKSIYYTIYTIIHN